ncbi:MAG: helix-turn-helix transcriptional regulator [Clostridia bacterium]|nr:helix-turn-helix transcriptional regulator [Clostridia bacterium]
MILDFSIRLRELRASKRLSQEQVAQIIGVTKSTISAYENDLRQPSFEILLKLANLYRVSTDYLLGRTDTVSVDLTDLTVAEATLVTELVSAMSVRNRRLARLVDESMYCDEE